LPTPQAVDKVLLLRGETIQRAVPDVNRYLAHGLPQIKYYLNSIHGNRDNTFNTCKAVKIHPI
jgi:hypothetical protein